MQQRFPQDRALTASGAQQLGVSPGRLRRMIRTGEVKSILYGVYVAASWVDTPESRAIAAAQVLPPHCVVVDRSAAALHGIDVLEYAELAVPPKLEVVSVGATATRRRGVLGGERDLRPADIVRVGGVLVTSPIRTACDIGCLRGRHRAIGAMDAFREKFGITEHELVAQLPRFAGRRGVVQLRELTPLTQPGRDSQPESWVGIDIYDEGYPMPAAQTWVDLPGWGPVKVENSYEHLRIGVEYDGEEHHSSDGDRAHDRARRDALADADWGIVVVRKDGFSHAGRALWLGELARYWADRAPQQLERRVYSRGPDRRRPW
ncbi:hypothetical protein [Nocardioides stalactiti]|uniref:hypothetical protein n=1 Tax=Nocardioides stalactiti TaxID=2755356 RepID=UPI001603E34B|nr:hypothetical protein [Nocardioides stalactiti]